MRSCCIRHHVNGFTVPPQNSRFWRSMSPDSPVLAHGSECVRRLRNQVIRGSNAEVFSARRQGIQPSRRPAGLGGTS